MVQTLTDEQIEWFIENFRHTKNAEICAQLDISLTTMHRYKREYHLSKTEEFMRETQIYATQAAKKAILEETYEQKQRRREIATQNNIRGRFKKGEYALRNKTEEERREISIRRVEKWRQTRKDEEMRLDWGKDLKYNFRFAKSKDPKKQKTLLNLRWCLRKLKYYIPKKGSMVVYITEDTQRNAKKEQLAQSLGMLVKFFETNVKKC